MTEMARFAAYELHVSKQYGRSAASFLNKLNFWQSRSNHQRYGRTWVYNTYEEWGRQLDLSPRTIKRVVTTLRRAGILEVGQHSPHRHNRTLWYSLNKEVLFKECPLPSGQTVTFHSDKMAPCSHRGLDMEETQKKRKRTNELKDGKTAEEVQTLFAAARAAPPTMPDNPNPSDLKRYWRKALPYYFDAIRELPPFTGKEEGQFKAFHRRAEGKAGILLKAALSDWRACRDYMRGFTGVSQPQIPTIGGLLTNLTAMINWVVNVEKRLQLSASTVSTTYTVKGLEKVKDAPIWLEGAEKHGRDG